MYTCMNIYTYIYVCVCVFVLSHGIKATSDDPIPHQQAVVCTSLLRRFDPLQVMPTLRWLAFRVGAHPPPLKRKRALLQCPSATMHPLAGLLTYQVNTRKEWVPRARPRPPPPPPPLTLPPGFREGCPVSQISFPRPQCPPYKTGSWLSSVTTGGGSLCCAMRIFCLLFISPFLHKLCLPDHLSRPRW